MSSPEGLNHFYLSEKCKKNTYQQATNTPIIMPRILVARRSRDKEIFCFSSQIFFTDTGNGFTIVLAIDCCCCCCCCLNIFEYLLLWRWCCCCSILVAIVELLLLDCCCCYSQKKDKTRQLFNDKCIATLLSYINWWSSSKLDDQMTISLS